MRGLSAADIVRVWERGAGQHPIDRALTILAASSFDSDGVALGDLPIGERNRRLLAIRERTFGGDLDALTPCASCGEKVTLRLPAAAFVDRAQQTVSTSAGTLPHVRRLTSRDLAAAAHCRQVDGARLVLARRALDRDVAAGDDDEILPEELVDAIAERLSEMDPLAVLVLDAACPTCGTHWESELDVAEFLWIEIEAEAFRVLRDVHTLATAYGWSESDILALPALRRRAYLELVQ